MDTLVRPIHPVTQGVGKRTANLAGIGSKGYWHVAVKGDTSLDDERLVEGAGTGACPHAGREVEARLETAPYRLDAVRVLGQCCANE